MQPAQLSDIEEHIYNFYSEQTETLQKENFTAHQAFWINFACFAVMPPNSSLKTDISLRSLIEMYDRIYMRIMVKIPYSCGKQPISDILKLKYLLIHRINARGKSLQTAIALGWLLLPDVQNPIRHTRAGLFIMKYSYANNQKTARYTKTLIKQRPGKTSNITKKTGRINSEKTKSLQTFT